MTVRPELPGHDDQRGSRGQREDATFPVPPTASHVPARYPVVATLRNAFAPNPCTSCWRRTTRSSCSIGAWAGRSWSRQRREASRAKVSDRLVAEYALRGFIIPIRIADWETRLVDSPPD